ncbi:unnamed protein product [Ectocarpus sp. 12 AP-2014]
MAYVNNKAKKGLLRGLSFKKPSTKPMKMDSLSPPEDTPERIAEQQTMADVKKPSLLGGLSFKKSSTKSTKAMDSPNPPEAPRDKTVPTTVVSGMGVLHGELPPTNRTVQSEETGPSVTSVPDDKILHIVEPAQSSSSGEVSSTSTIHARDSLPAGEVEASKPSTGNLSAGSGEEVYDAGGASSVTPPLDVKVPEVGERYVVVSGMNSLPGEAAVNSTSAPKRPAHASKLPTGGRPVCVNCGEG